MSVSSSGVSLAQILFSVALGLIALGIVAFAAFVVATTTRSTRWFRRQP